MQSCKNTNSRSDGNTFIELYKKTCCVCVCVMCVCVLCVCVYIDDPVNA